MLEQLESKNEKKLVKKFSKNGGIEIMENKELKENNIDNKYGIEYTKVGDYYMPNLVLEKEEKIILNKYGRLRLKFLKENKKAEYTIMFMNGTLNNHLKEIQETAEEKVGKILEQALERGGRDNVTLVLAQISGYEEKNILKRWAERHSTGR